MAVLLWLLGLTLARGCHIFDARQNPSKSIENARKHHVFHHFWIIFGYFLMFFAYFFFIFPIF